MDGTLYTSSFNKWDRGVGLKISVARYNPSWLVLPNEQWYTDLAPEDDLLMDFKSGRLTWEDYKARYLSKDRIAVMHNQLLNIFSMLQMGIDITLYCHCPPTKHCHCREIIGEEFRRLGFSVIQI